MNSTRPRRGHVNLSEILAQPPADDDLPHEIEGEGESPQSARPQATPAEATVPPFEDGGTSPQQLEPARGSASPAAEPRPAARRGRPRTKPAGESTTLVLWCPESIRARMRAKAKDGVRFLDQVLDALEDNADELDQLVADTSPKVHAGRLFERTVPRESTTETRVQVTIRGALPSHLDVIDQLVTTTGAGSRSALISAALDKHLPKRPRSMR